MAHVCLDIPSIVVRTLDDVWRIVVRFLATESYLPLLEHVQTACMDPRSLLSTARPTRGYFPAAKAAGAQS